MNTVLSRTLFVLICSYENKLLPPPSVRGPIAAAIAPHLPCAKCLKVKVKCITEVKYESTMSWQAYSVTPFRICQVVEEGGSLCNSAPTSAYAGQMESLWR